MKFLNPIKHEKKIPILMHIEELRYTLICCLISLILGCIVVSIFFPYFTNLLNWPLKQCIKENPDLLKGLVTTTPMDIFSVLLQICCLAGFSLSLPFIIYFLTIFVIPGLNKSERKILIPICLSLFILFIIGALFSYFLIIPSSLSVAMYLNKVFGFQLIWSASHYYGLIAWLTLGIGFCFELPLLIVLLVFLQILNIKHLKRHRRHAIIIILLIAAFITPGGDPFTLGILSIPLYILYESTILFCKFLKN